MRNPETRSMHVAHAGAEKLLKIWRLSGIPVGWTTTGMMLFAELIRDAGFVSIAMF